MDQYLVTIGILLVLAGLVLGVVSVFRSIGSRARSRRAGAVIIIGPIPIVFASDTGTTKILLVLSILLVIVLMALFLRL